MSILVCVSSRGCWGARLGCFFAPDDPTAVEEGVEARHRRLGRRRGLSRLNGGGVSAGRLRRCRAPAAWLAPREVPRDATGDPLESLGCKPRPAAVQKRGPPADSVQPCPARRLFLADVRGLRAVVDGGIYDRELNAVSSEVVWISSSPIVNGRMGLGGIGWRNARSHMINAGRCGHPQALD